MLILEKKYVVFDVGLWVMNIFSLVGIIMVNKQVMLVVGYDF